MMATAKSPPIQPDLPNTTILKRIAHDNLIVQLESMHGTKDLVLDEELMKPLDRIAGISVLKRHGVEKIFKLDVKGIETGCNRRIYITRPYISRMKMIVEHIRKDQLNSIRGEYRVLMTPKRLAVCELVLEREGIYGDVTIDEFPLDFIMLDNDVLSMEMPLYFKNCFYDGDYTWTSVAARMMNTIQMTYGAVKNFTCIGNNSKTVYDLLQIFMEEEKEYVPPGGPEIGSAVFIDRDVDYVTPLCSQLAYEGLISDVFGISSGYSDFGKEVTGGEKSVRVLLDSSDQVFEEIRGMHFTSVFPLLSSKARELQFGYDKRKDMTTVSQLKNFVSQDLKMLKQQHKSLTLHIGACESILKKKTAEEIERFLQTEQNLLDDRNVKDTADFVEDCINKQHRSIDSLRLLCLLSLTRGTLDMNRLKSLKLQYLQSYGYNRLLTLYNLKKCGILAENPDRKGLFQKARRKLNLVPKDPSIIDLKNPNDMSYVFGGAYSPLSIKLIEQLLLKGAQSIEDLTKTLNVPLFCIRRPSSVRARGSHTQASDAALRTVLLVFLGGCSHSEITALRFLGMQQGYRFLVLTTAIFNGNSFIESMLSSPLGDTE